MLTKPENILQEKIITSHSLGGGCIADSQVIKTESGKKYFIKKYAFPNIHKTEANGLTELAKPNVIKIPEVIFYDDEILILDFIQEGRKKNNFFEDFGRPVAKLHKFTAEKFGFYADNYCGSTPQKNIPMNDDWTEFYFNNRLLLQYKLAEKNNYVTAELKSSFLKLESKINKIIQTEEKPALLHGDLWGGNYIVDANGNACLIDPAVYYGNREADLAMTKIFGGFDSLFYEAYQKEFPLPDGWQYRENIYKLYHIFNHLNLFGMTYYNQVMELINFYL